MTSAAWLARHADVVGAERSRPSVRRAGRYCAQYCSIVVSRVERWTRSLARDVDRAHDPLVVARDVEHVEAARRLLEAAEEHALAGQRVREDRAVDGAVRDDERGVPAAVGDEPLDRREHAVEELADRLAAEEPLLVRHDAAEGADERLLELVRRDRRELRAHDLAELGPALDSWPGATSAAVWSVRGRPEAITRSSVDAVEQRARRLGLLAALRGERDVVLRAPGGRRRRSTPRRRGA